MTRTLLKALLALFLAKAVDSISIRGVEYTTRQVNVGDDKIDVVALVLTFDEAVYFPVVPLLNGIDVSVVSCADRLTPELIEMLYGGGDRGGQSSGSYTGSNSESFTGSRSSSEFVPTGSFSLPPLTGTPRQPAGSMLPPLSGTLRPPGTPLHAGSFSLPPLTGTPSQPVGSMLPPLSGTLRPPGTPLPAGSFSLPPLTGTPSQPVGSMLQPLPSSLRPPGTHLPTISPSPSGFVAPPTNIFHAASLRYHEVAGQSLFNFRSRQGYVGVEGTNSITSTSQSTSETQSSSWSSSTDSYSSDYGGYSSDYGGYSSDYESSSRDYGSYTSVSGGGYGDGYESGPKGPNMDQVLQIITAFALNRIDRIDFCIWEAYRTTFQFMGFNLFNLTCDGQPVVKEGFDFENFMNQGPPPLLMMPWTDDIVADLLALSFDLKDRNDPITFSSNKFALVWLDKMYTGVQAEEREISKVANLTGKVQQGKCDLTVQPIFFGSNSRLPKTTISGRQFVPIETPFCDYSDLSVLVDNFQVWLSELKGASNWTDLERIRQKVGVLTAKNTWVGCQSILDKAFLTSSATFQRVSKDCVAKKGTIDYASDPCCNKTLGDYFCCAPRNVQYKYDILTGLNDTFVARTCLVTENNVESFLGVLSDYMAEITRINDPKTGCIANTLSSADISERNFTLLWDKYTGFMQECLTDIFGSNGFYSLDTSQSRCDFGGGQKDSQTGKECTTDSDCYTSCFKDSPSSTTGKCVVPFSNPWPYIQTCYIDKMHPRMKAALLRQWNVFNATDVAAFGEKFIEKTSIGSCTGPTGCAYNGGWYQFNNFYCNFQNRDNSVSSGVSGPIYSTCPKEYPANYTDSSGVVHFNLSVYDDIKRGKFIPCYSWNNDLESFQRQGCFKLPPNQQACVQDRGCNWFHWSTYNIPNYCGVDRLDNGGNFCAFDYGSNQLYDASMRGGCAVGGWFQSGLTRFSAEWNRTALRCRLLDGKLYQDPLQASSWAQTFCFKQGLDDASSCLSECFAGPNPGRQYFCMNPKVTTQDQCAQFSNSTRGFWSYLYWSYNPVTYRSTQSCVIWNVDNSTCSAVYGSRGFSYEAISKTETEIRNELSGQCSQDYCYNKRFNNSNDCWRSTSTPGTLQTFYTNWNPQLNSNKGLCTAYPMSGVNAENPLAFMNFCNGLGGNWTFYQGRRYVDGSVDTRTKCENEGLCDWNPQLGQKDCTSVEYCTNYCQTCESYRTDSSICSHTNQTQCQIDNALWRTINGTAQCIYTTEEGITNCKRVANSQTLTCKSFAESTSRDFSRSSQACSNNPYSAFLQCYQTWNRCPDENSCDASGMCDDWDLQDYGFSFYDGSRFRFVESDGSGMCIIPSAVNQFGFADCSKWYRTHPFVRVTKLGCAFSSKAMDDIKCAEYGGTRVKKSEGRKDCIAHKRCCEGSPCRFSLKSEAECHKCNGTMKSVYQWYGGKWVRGAMRTGVWSQREVKSLNSWTQVIDFKLMNQFVSRAAGTVISELVSTELKCQYNSLLGHMKTIACACGVNANADRCQFSAGTNQILAEGELSCGEEREILAGGAGASFGSDSLTNCSSTTSFEITRVTSNPQDSNSTSTGFTKRDTVQSQAACYAYVQNTVGAFVGQVRGDCVTFTPSGPVRNVEICMAIKSTISWDSATYPVAGVARLTRSGSSNVYTATSDVPFESNGQFCFNTNAGGTFCPVSLRSSWSSLTSGVQPSCSFASGTLQSIAVANTLLTGSAVGVEFVTQPSSTIQAGTVFSNIVVRFVNNQGNLASDASASITLTVVSASGVAKILGVPRVAATGGSATFTNVAIDIAGTGYTLRATSGSLNAATSSAFSVTAGAATKLQFSRQPGGAVIDIAFLQQPIVSITDVYGNVVSGRTDIVTLTASSTDAVSGQSVTRSFSVGVSPSISAVSGVATFVNIAMPSTFSGVILTATSSGLTAAYSSSFNVVSRTGFAVKLRFEQAPTEGLAGSSFPTQPIVSVRDFDNGLVSSNVQVTLTLLTTTDEAVTVKGSTTISAVGGQAVFTGLSVDRAGANYRWVASATGLASATSASLMVSGASAIEFTDQPSVGGETANVKASTPFTIKVRVLNVDGTVLSSRQTEITVAIKPFTGSTGAVLGGFKTANTNNGEATFSLTIGDANFGYVITARTSNGVTAESAPFNIVQSGESTDNDDDDGGGNKVVDTIKNLTGLSTEIIGAIAASAVVIMATFGVIFVRRRMLESTAKANKKGVQK